MKLHELDPDTILAQLERRDDAFVEAQDALNRIEASHKRMEASVYLAYRSSGKSIEDAKRHALNDDGVVDSLMELHDAQREAQKAKAAVMRAKSAQDLWRSIQANRRNL